MLVHCHFFFKNVQYKLLTFSRGKLHLSSYSKMEEINYTCFIDKNWVTDEINCIYPLSKVEEIMHDS